MKVKGVLYIIIGVIALISPILAFKSITIEYGHSTEPVLIGFRILFILGGLVLIATGIGAVIDSAKQDKPLPPPITSDYQQE